MGCMAHQYAALEDQSAEVRKAAQEVVLPFMLHLRYDSMARQVNRDDQAMGDSGHGRLRPWDTQAVGDS